MFCVLAFVFVFLLRPCALPVDLDARLFSTKLQDVGVSLYPSIFSLYLFASIRPFHYCYSRGQIDLIDFQHCPDGEFRYLLTYVDHGTKYAMVKALKSKVIYFAKPGFT